MKLFENKLQIIGIIAGIILASFTFLRYPMLQTASIISPLGGETFLVDKPIELRWTPGSPGIRQIELIPRNYTPIVLYQTSVFGYPVYDTSGSFTFIPSERGIANGDYYVKIYTAGSSDYSETNSPIRIVLPQLPATPMVVTSPNGGETFTLGNPVRISWSGGRNKVLIGIAKGEYMPGGTHPLLGLITKEGIPNSSLTWDGKLCVLENDCRPVTYWQPNGSIKVVAVSENSEGIYCTQSHDRPCNLDASDGAFTIKTTNISPPLMLPPTQSKSIIPSPSIVRKSVPVITVISPNGGEYFKDSSPIEIRWRTKSAPSNMVINITLFTKNQAENKDYIWVANVAYKTENDGVQVWKIPNNIPVGYNYFIRIGCNYPQGTPYLGCKSDDSDKAFSILKYR